MYICELSEYSLKPFGNGNGIKKFYLALSKGDVCSVKSESSDDARALLRALATLAEPVTGRYVYNGKELNFSDYRELLPFKRKIGYIASDSGILSNRTIRENIFISSYYFEDSIPLEIYEKAMTLCTRFEIEDKLDFRSAELNIMDVRLAITIRELIKSPDILILERPEDFMEHNKFHVFIDILNSMIHEEMPVVFFSKDVKFLHKFTKKMILITDGNLTTVQENFQTFNSSPADL